MDLTNPDTLKSLLLRYHIRPSESLGQNFLIDAEVFKAIISAAELNSSDVVLEIGSGVGNLTMELAGRCKQVIAIEKDKRMIKPLRFVLKDFSNASIINDDILKINLPNILEQTSQNPPSLIPDSKFLIPSFKVVANIPYYITGEILRLFLEFRAKPRLLVILVQKEVAERVIAGPGEMSILSVSVQLYSRPEIVDVVSASSFWPEPKVVSAILKMTVYDKPVLDVDEKRFFNLVKIGFSA
ncbi:MAG: 16S rRNA (adenine(1518)-N(6)/adenine(1519)-N(6))-dimethyltransferase RsmA, partial [Patescibacteria group bacterium]